MDDVSNPWLSQPTAPDGTAHLAAAPTLTTPPSGPLMPQGGVQAPDRVDQLPTFDHRMAAELWWVGAHGGAGETTLAGLVPSWQAAHHAWPRVPGYPAPSRVVLTARSNVNGLRAAQSAATQWAAGLAPFVQLIGLVIVADAPGKTPKPIRELTHLVSGGVPRTWHVPWNEAWRLGEQSSLDTAPRPVRRLVDDLNTVIRTGAPGTAN